MKSPHITYMRAGFTLVEVLVTMFIIAILSVVTLGVLTQTGDRVKYQQTETLIAQLENSLESYYFDNQDYPRSAVGAGSVEYAELLFQELGGYNSDGSIPSVVPTSFADYLEPSGKNVAQTNGAGNYRVVDPWGNYIRYTPASNGVSTNNPDFDLWSIGAEEVIDTDSDTVDNVSNW